MSTLLALNTWTWGFWNTLICVHTVADVALLLLVRGTAPQVMAVDVSSETKPLLVPTAVVAATVSVAVAEHPRWMLAYWALMLGMYMAHAKFCTNDDDDRWTRRRRRVASWLVSPFRRPAPIPR